MRKKRLSSQNQGKIFNRFMELGTLSCNNYGSLYNYMFILIIIMSPPKSTCSYMYNNLFGNLIRHIKNFTDSVQTRPTYKTLPYTWGTEQWKTSKSLVCPCLVSQQTIYSYRTSTTWVGRSIADTVRPVECVNSSYNYN